MNKKHIPKILIILTIGIISIVVAGYFYVVPKKIPIDRILNEYTTKGYAYDVKFKTWPKLKFNYRSDWIVTEEGDLGGKGKNRFDHVEISKNGYSIAIEQRLMTGAGGCQFKDSPIPEWPAIDLTMVEYKDIDTNLGHLRYFKFPLSEFDDPETPQNTYGFCMKQGDTYQVLPVGDITIEIPPAPNEKIFTEALDIVKSIKPIQ